jgi:N-ethylmaleimide reductase
MTYSIKHLFHINAKRSDVFKAISSIDGYTAASAEAALQAGLADLIAFGKPFIANPDLVERFRRNTPLAVPDEDTFYQGGDTGYIDYPAVYNKRESLCDAV